MTKQVEKRTVDTFNFKGIITGTSNKVSTEFTTDSPRKTAYVKVDKDTQETLLQNGLRLYTSKEGEDFFIIKLSEKLTAWVGKESYEISTHIGTDNFSTPNEIFIACIKGKNKGNNYIRIYALGLKSMEEIALVGKENPFAINDSVPF